MNAIVFQKIITIINDISTLEHKRQLLRDTALKLSESEQVTKILVIELLSEHIMPFELNKPLHVYELKAATEDTYKTLSQLLIASECNYFNATCGELLWDHYHDVVYAGKAIRGYWQEILSPSLCNDHSYYEAALGLCRIYAKYHVPDFDFDVFYDHCTNYLIDHLDKLQHFGVTLLEALSLCGVLFEDVNDLAKDIIMRLEKSKDYDLAIAYERFLEAQYSSNKQSDNVLATRERIARLYEASADAYDWQNPKVAHRIIHQIQNAMNTWNRIGNVAAQDERKRLAKRLIPVKKASLEAMQTFKSEPFDLTEVVNHLKETIEKSSMEDCIYYLAFIAKLETPSSLEEYRKQSPTLISSMFPTTIIDQAGRKKCIVPAFYNASPEDRIHALEYEASKRYSTLAQAFLLRYVYLLQNKGEIPEDILRSIMKENAFVPEDRIESFIKGIAAGFKMDFITAIPILMPQVENAIRVLAENCGAVVYKTKADGTEECLSLESILKLPEVVECLDEDLLFNMRVFFTSDYGIGMRNNNGHGLLADNQLQSDNSIAVWWFTLRLCCMFSYQLNKTLADKKR